MKTFIQANSALICLIVLALPTSAAGSWRNRTYDVTYSSTTSMGPGTIRMAADGHGRALMESNKRGINSTFITDANTNVCYMLSNNGGNRTAMKMPFEEGKQQAATAEDMRQKNATPLGVKIVAGHPCHGYRYRMGDTVSDTWVADDLDITVASSSNSTTSGAMSMMLQSYSPKAPPESSFTLPPGIQVMDMGALNRAMQNGDYSSIGKGMPMIPSSAGGPPRTNNNGGED